MDDKFFKDAMQAVGLPVITIDEDTDFSKLGNPFQSYGPNEEAWEDRTRTVNFFTVALYLENQAYGGPEEGGWWYDCGERVDCGCGIPEIDNVLPAIFKREDLAIEFADKLRAYLDIANRGRRPIGSVLCEGIYTIRVEDNYPPSSFPETTPHYE
jgi:hypothetical protein